MREKPLSKFRVYVHGSSLFFHVYVWRTQRELWESRNRRRLKRTRCDAYTYTYWERNTTTNRLAPIVGEIHFYRSSLRAGAAVEIIAHEAFHATLSVLRRVKASFKGWDKDAAKDTSEEIGAKLNGVLAKTIHAEMYRRGLVDIDYGELQTKSRKQRIPASMSVLPSATVSRCRTNACGKGRNRRNRK